MSERNSFVSIWGEVSGVREMFIERIGYTFVGGFDVVIELNGTVRICSSLCFVVEGFDCFPIDVLVLFVIPVIIYVVFPDLFFVICYVLVYFEV